jgi:hypothetical protein
MADREFPAPVTIQRYFPEIRAADYPGPRLQKDDSPAKPVLTISISRTPDMRFAHSGERPAMDSAHIRGLTVSASSVARQIFESIRP